MTSRTVLDPSGKLLTYVTPVTHVGQVGESEYPFRWDEVEVPASPFGTFRYEVELSRGRGWFSADHLTPGRDAPLSGERRRVLIIMPSERVEIRLRAIDWSATPEELRGVDRSRLAPFIQPGVPHAIRDRAFHVLTHLDPKDRTKCGPTAAGL